MVFCTKRNKYGHRHMLEVDCIKRTVKVVNRWYSSDFIEVSSKSLETIKAELIEAGYIVEV